MRACGSTACCICSWATRGITHMASGGPCQVNINTSCAMHLNKGQMLFLMTTVSHVHVSCPGVQLQSPCSGLQEECTCREFLTVLLQENTEYKQNTKMNTMLICKHKWILFNFKIGLTFAHQAQLNSFITTQTSLLQLHCVNVYYMCVGSKH